MPQMSCNGTIFKKINYEQKTISVVLTITQSEHKQESDYLKHWIHMGLVPYVCYSCNVFVHDSLVDTWNFSKLWWNLLSFVSRLSIAYFYPLLSCHPGRQRGYWKLRSSNKHSQYSFRQTITGLPHDVILDSFFYSTVLSNCMLAVSHPYNYMTRLNMARDWSISLSHTCSESVQLYSIL